VIKDLVVDRSAFDRIIAAGGFVSARTGSPADANAILVPRDDAERAMDAAACIGCGACVAACKNASAMLFVAAKVSHLAALPQGEPERERRVLAMVERMDAEGFGNCTNESECQAACPRASPWPTSPASTASTCARGSPPDRGLTAREDRTALRPFSLRRTTVPAGNATRTAHLRFPRRIAEKGRPAAFAGLRTPLGTTLARPVPGVHALGLSRLVPDHRAQLMNKLILTGALVALGSVTLLDNTFGHGGTYAVPGDTVPPGAGGGGGGGPASPTPGAPSSPGTSGPATPGPAAPAPRRPAARLRVRQPARRTPRPT
jgi:ferredoxin